MKAIIFGAGSIGRGFLGDLLNRSDFELVFVDVDKNLIQKMNDKDGYTVSLVDNKKTEQMTIPIKCAIDGNDIDAVANEIASCDLICTAVGMNALKFITKALATGIKLRAESVNIILCENMVDAHEVLRDLLKPLVSDDQLSKVGFLRASVGRMVPLPVAGEDLLVVKAEPYSKLPVDADGIVGTMPEFAGLQNVSPFDYAIERKLYIHNLGHVACAWLGVQKGYKYIWQAVSDEEVKLVAYKAMKQAAAALVKKYNVSMQDLDDHIEDLLNRFANRALGDTVDRVGRDLLRKLSPTDRAVGALNMCIEFDLERDAIRKVISAGLQFDGNDDGSKKIVEMMNKKGIDYVLKHTCEVADKADIIRIIEVYNER